MKSELLLNVMGMISDDMILDAKTIVRKKTAVKKRFSVKKTVAWIAAAVLFFSFPLPMLAANIPFAYEVLYAISPETAQKFKLVQMSCENNGIRLEVVSAYIHDETAEIYISVQDLAGGRIDETTDLFDSYNINRAFDCSATCRKISYDEKTQTVTFLICITQWKNKNIEGSKLTFTVKEFLSNKQKFESSIPQIDLKTANLSPQTQANISIRGGSWNGNGRDFYEKYENGEYLLPSSEGLYSPVDGVTVTAMGFIDGKLHIQIHYKNILETDNHGYVYLVDKNGNKIFSEASVSFWDSDKKGSYDEQIFDVSPNEIESYSLCGKFTTCNTLTKGNWQVTFPLEYEK